jgi:argininosuccinate synthase
MTSPQRCVLAYSGGLDTSVAIPWMRENLGTEVIALSIDLGEARDLRSVQERALRTGAVAAYVVDARRLFVENFAFPSLMAGALYEGVYPLATAPTPSTKASTRSSRRCRGR